MLHTLGTAAKATGVSKPTLCRAIKSGKLSANRNEDGSYSIDPAELFRVYTPVSETGDKTDKMEQSEKDKSYSLLQQTLETLREVVAHLEDDRNDLRRRLDSAQEAREKAADEVHRLTLMLTHQKQQEQEREPPAAPIRDTRLEKAWKVAAAWLAVVAVIVAASIGGVWVLVQYAQHVAQ